MAQYLKFLNAFKKNYPQEGNLQTESPNNPELDLIESQISDEADSESNDVVSRNAEVAPDFDDVIETQSLIQDNASDTIEQETDDTTTPTRSSAPASERIGIGLKRKPINKSGLSAVDRCAIDYFNAKKRKLDTVVITASSQQEKDPCELFLLSIVPQMKTMSPRQQLSFQKGILDLIEKIKYPQQSFANQQRVYSPASASATSYYNTFATYQHQEDRLHQLTPAHSNTHYHQEQQGTHLHELTSSRASTSHTHSQYQEQEDTVIQELLPSHTSASQ